MSESLTYQGTGTATRDRTHTLFAQTMAYVAATAGLFAAGAYLGRNLTGAAGIVAFIAAFAALIGMRFAARRSRELTVGLLGAFGLLIGVAVAPTLATTRAWIRVRCGRPVALRRCSSPGSGRPVTPPTATWRRSRGSASGRCWP